MRKQAKGEFLRRKRWSIVFASIGGRSTSLSQTCDYSNKYAIRLLNAAKFPLTEKPKKRQSFYTQENVCRLKRIWRECDFLCGKLLAPMIPTVLESFELDGIAVPANIRTLLLKISPASIDRMLKTAKR